MTGYLRAEARKLTSVRAWWLLMIGAAGFPLITVFALATDPATDLDGAPETILSLIRLGADITAVAALWLGILATAGEYRHGTIIGSLLAAPSRSRFVGAKLVVLGGAGALLALATAVTSSVAGGLYLRSLGADLGSAPIGDALAVLAGVMCVAALYGAIGAGLGAVVRNQIAAVTGALVWIMAVEGILPDVLRKPGLRDWLLTGAAKRLYQLPDPVPDAPSAWVAAGLLIGVAAGFGLAGSAVTRFSEIK